METIDVIVHTVVNDNETIDNNISNNINIDHEILLTLWALSKPFQCYFEIICFVITLFLLPFIYCGPGWIGILALIFTFPLQLTWMPIYFVLWIVAQVLVRIGCSCLAKCADRWARNNTVLFLDDKVLMEEIFYMPYTLVMVNFLGERD